MKSINNKFLLLIFLISSTVGIVKAETYHLDLNSSIEVAKMRSYDMLMLKQDLKIAGFNLKAAISQHRTHVDLNFTTPNYSQTIREFTDSIGYVTYYTENKLGYGGNINISQPLPTDGEFYINSSIGNTDDFINDNRRLLLGVELGIRQPIDAFFGYNQLQSRLKNARLNYERTEKRLKRSELDLVYSVSSSFYSLLSLQKREEIARLNLERQQEAYEISKNKFDAGLIREVDALQMEVDLAEAQNNYDLSIANQGSAMNRFKELLGLEYEDSIVLNNDLQYDIVIVDPNKAVELAMSNRSEIRESEIQIELSELTLREIKATGKISGNLIANYNRNGVAEAAAGMNLESMVNDSYDNLTTRPAGYVVGLNLSVPLIDWGENRARVRSAEAALKQNTYRKEIAERQIKREVLNLVTDFNSSLKRLQLLEKNVKVAESSFEITRLRYADGDIDSQALALERERLNNAYVSHLSAYIDYQLQLADLMRKTFYDFKNNRPID